MGKEIRLTRAAKLAQRTVDMALQKYLNKDSIDWLFQRIGWFRLEEESPLSETHVHIEGRLYDEHRDRIFAIVFLGPRFPEGLDDPEDLCLLRVEMIYEGKQRSCIRYFPNDLE